MLRFTLTLIVPDKDPAQVLMEALEILADDFRRRQLLISRDTGMGVTNSSGEEIGNYTCWYDP